MKKIVLTAFAGLLVLNTMAQVCGDRYLKKIYTNVNKTTVTYSTANSTSLVMDVYEPIGDTATIRPLIILAHGGSFTGGDRTEGDIVTLCNNFAKRGYVTASIEYRLAPNLLSMIQYNSAVDVVMKAISDGKAAVRWFRKDAATTNTYKIDPNKIFIGGNSAGAVLAVHMAYIDNLSECPAAMQPIITSNGGLEGNSGNAGYSSAVSAVLNLAGGVHDVSMIGTGEEPIVSFHGDQDNVVPYTCANAQNGLTPVQLCGLGSMEPVLTAKGINHVSKVYPGDGHVPWVSDAIKLNQVDSISADFLYTLLCFTNVGVENNTTTNLNLYPNPTTNHFVIENEMQISTVSIANNLGQIVATNKVNDTKKRIDVSALPVGIYTVKAQLVNGKYAVSKLVKE